MKRLAFGLALLMTLLVAGCGDDGQEDLWNDVRIGDDIYHFTQVEFQQNDRIVCVGQQQGIMTLQLTLADGTAVTRLQMLQCPEGYHADLDATQGRVQVTLEGTDGHDGLYNGIEGLVTVERHEFKTIIDMQNLRLVNPAAPADTVSIDHGYLSFDLSFF